MRIAQFYIGKKTVTCQVPEHWNELSVSQFKAIVDKTYCELDDVAFYARYFGITEDIVHSIDIYYVYVLGSLLKFTREMKGSTKFLVPSVRLFGPKPLTVVSPSPALAGMSFMQFMMIDTFYTWYGQTKDRKHLVDMCCCCYLKEDENFFEMEMDERRKSWSLCGENDLFSVLVQWSLIKAWLSASYPYLFSSKEGGQPATSKNGKVVLNNTWLEIFDSLVEEDLTRIDTYKRLACMDVFRIINRKIKNSKQNKR